MWTSKRRRICATPRPRRWRRTSRSSRLRAGWRAGFSASRSPGLRVPGVPGRIVLFGATGYTGRLVAAALVDRGARPVLAGPNADSLGAMSDELGGGLETQTADVSDPATVRALVQRGDVLVSTVGPFRK